MAALLRFLVQLAILVHALYFVFFLFFMLMNLMCIMNNSMQIFRIVIIPVTCMKEKSGFWCSFTHSVLNGLL